LLIKLNDLELEIASGSYVHYTNGSKNVGIDWKQLDPKTRAELKNLVDHAGAVLEEAEHILTIK
jgi:hypothetical protein